MTADDLNTILEIKESYQAPSVILEKLREGKGDELCKKIVDASGLDFGTDIFSSIFEEEHAERKKSKQDFTPDGVCRLLSSLLGSTNTLFEPCTGTGSLVLALWRDNRDIECECWELSTRTIPFLLLNLMIHNIKARVYHGDSLKFEAFAKYEIERGLKYGQFKECELAESRDESTLQLVMDI